MSAQYRFTLSDDYLITSILRQRQQRVGRYLFNGMRWLLASVLLGIGVYSSIAAEFWHVLPFVIMASFLFLAWPIDKWTTRRQHLNSPYRDDTMEVTVSEHGVNATGRVTEVTFDWSTFTKARRFKDGLLLFRGSQLCWLPDIAGSTPEASAEALRLARSNVRDFRDV